MGHKRKAPHPWAVPMHERIPQGQIPPLVNASRRIPWPGNPDACAYCQRDDLTLTRDHIIPRRRGGPDVPVNIASACEPCNVAKDGIVPLGVRIEQQADGFILVIDWPLLRSEVRNLALVPAYRKRRMRGYFGERTAQTPGHRRELPPNFDPASARGAGWKNPQRTAEHVAAPARHLSGSRRTWLTITSDADEPPRRATR